LVANEYRGVRVYTSVPIAKALPAPSQCDNWTTNEELNGKFSKSEESEFQKCDDLWRGLCTAAAAGGRYPQELHHSKRWPARARCLLHHSTILGPRRGGGGGGIHGLDVIRAGGLEHSQLLAAHRWGASPLPRPVLVRTKSTRITLWNLQEMTE
jgi:hypothetical protein